MHNVLIADDSKAMRLQVTRVVREVLPQANIQYASSGAEVLRMWRSDTPPDLMILDIHMPVLNGLEVLRHMTAGGDRPPSVIIYTASRDEVMREQCLNAGATAIVTKSHEDIHEAIRNALQL
jgi:CheY-like chemotaxis protein